MARRLALPILVLAAIEAACGTGAAVVRTPAAPAPPASSSGDFEAKVRPLLVSRCSPCHFEGGKMYASLPFDRPETIRTLGERLFTRIKDEESRTLVRAFLAQPRS